MCKHGGFQVVECASASSGFFHFTDEVTPFHSEQYLFVLSYFWEHSWSVLNDDFNFSCSGLWVVREMKSKTKKTTHGEMYSSFC